MNLYAVIGYPIKHSLSPQLHRFFAKQTGLSIEYIKIESQPHHFKQTVLEFQSQGGKGCNVTLPFKAEAFSLAHTAGDVATLAETANVLTFKDGIIIADNTDGFGFVNDLRQQHNFNFKDKKILILGAGGATSGILGECLKAEPNQIVIANRSFDKALLLAKKFEKYGTISIVPLDNIPLKNFDLIVHATSLGHFNSNRSFSFPKNLVGKHTICYDISYGKAAKPFLSWAKSAGAQLATDGRGMLIEQARATFYLWHGIWPNAPENSLIIF